MKRLVLFAVFGSILFSCSKEEINQSSESQVQSRCGIIIPGEAELIDPEKPCDSDNSTIQMSWGASWQDNCMSNSSPGGYLWWRSSGTTTWNGGLTYCQSMGNHIYRWSIAQPIFSSGACIEVIWSSDINTTTNSPSGLWTINNIQTLCF